MWQYEVGPAAWQLICIKEDVWFNPQYIVSIQPRGSEGSCIHMRNGNRIEDLTLTVAEIIAKLEKANQQTKEVSKNN